MSVGVDPQLLLRAPLALVPVLLFLAALLHFDSYKLLRLRAVLAMLAAGALAAGASYLVNSYAYSRFAGDFESYSRYVSPWIEELLKALLLVYLIRTRRVGMPVDAGIAGFAIGTGFALIENLYYLASRPDAALAVQVIRGFGTAIMHGGTGVLLGIISIALHEKRLGGGLQLFVPGLVAAVALHSGFNHLLARPAFATLAILVVLPLVIYLAFQRSERGLRAWLDADLDSKVELLEAINSGTFLDSGAGRYLESLRDRFRGEDLADMLCYLRLHGELALRAKGVLLLRESGIDPPPLDEALRAALAEIAALEHAIGRTGMLALRPLLMATGKDLWQLRLLTH